MKKLRVILIILTVLTLVSCSRGDIVVYEGTLTPSSTANETENEGEGSLVLVSMTENVKAGGTATVIVKGRPDTEYDINVYYSTTVSTAKGLENKRSDEQGNLNWSWKVGSRTKTGTYKITVTDGNETLILYFNVT